MSGCSFFELTLIHKAHSCWDLWAPQGCHSSWRHSSPQRQTPNHLQPSSVTRTVNQNVWDSCTKITELEIKYVRSSEGGPKGRVHNDIKPQAVLVQVNKSIWSLPLLSTVLIYHGTSKKAYSYCNALSRVIPENWLHALTHRYTSSKWWWHVRVALEQSTECWEGRKVAISKWFALSGTNYEIIARKFKFSVLASVFAKKSYVDKLDRYTKLSFSLGGILVLLQRWPRWI